MGTEINTAVMMNKMVIEVALKPCPWCKETPEINMPISDDLNTNGTWLWSIQCRNTKCKINPTSPTVAIRGECKLKFERILEKIDKLAASWNEGNDLKAKDKKVIDLTPIQRLVSEKNYKRLIDHLKVPRTFF